MKDNHIDVQITPNKIYFNISEAGKLCEVQPHVLRYWEQEFKELQPIKGHGGRRYYQKKDIELIKKIKDLLYNRRFTIEGAKQQLRKNAHSQEPTQKIMQEVKIILQKLLQNLMN